MSNIKTKHGGFGRIKEKMYKGKPAIVKKLKINVSDNLSLYLSKIGATTKKKYKNPIIESVLSTEDEAKKMIMCRREVGDNIAEVYGYNKEKCEIYMKKYDGDITNLKHLLKLKDKYNIVLDIINGLHTMHSLNLVHSDLKCANVLYEYDKIEDRYVAYITDFGVSGYINECIYGSTEGFCPKYDSKLTVKFDIYSLGKTMVEFFCDLDPNSTQFDNLDYDNFPKYCHPKNFGNEDFYDVVRKSLKDYPEERPNLIDFVPPAISMIPGIPF